MMRYRTVALPTSIAETVRATLRSPGYGHPAHVEVATGHGPCRHCLRAFRVGEERRILFTHDPFAGLEAYPLPGPVFVHAEPCARHPEAGGFPEDLTERALALSAYARGRILREQVRLDGIDAEREAVRLLARADVDYIHVHDLAAGCYDFRIERAEAENGETHAA